MNKRIENRIEALNEYLEKNDWSRARECVEAICTDYENNATPITELYMVMLCTRVYRNATRLHPHDERDRLMLTLKKVNTMYNGEVSKQSIKPPSPSFNHSNNLTKLQASNRAEELVVYMNEITGGLWGMRVWNNLGWHYEIYCGGITISEYVRQDKEATYRAMVSDKVSDSGCNAMPPYLAAHRSQHLSPQSALIEALHVLLNQANMIQSALNHNLDRLNCKSCEELAERISNRIGANG